MLLKIMIFKSYVAQMKAINKNLKHIIINMWIILQELIADIIMNLFADNLLF